MEILRASCGEEEPRGRPAIDIMKQTLNVVWSLANFEYFSAGDPRSVHEARVYRKSELHTLLTPQKFPLDSHLLGDGAYPLRQSLLVPYRNIMLASCTMHVWNGTTCTTDPYTFTENSEVTGPEPEEDIESGDDHDAPTASEDKSRGAAKRKNGIMQNL
ncbi:hypothetical protein HPB47_006313 [Ixodes persulcatus]|uniref:Uncharacterized protein n=1 Tax=Ixodes persulcatus TaxID=34615 RepID=A0AC60PBI4_IXOPE|nr:hypothetical protein HPB47_006313 [Ixodes persulcatus]